MLSAIQHHSRKSVGRRGRARVLTASAAVALAAVTAAGGLTNASADESEPAAEPSVAATVELDVQDVPFVSAIPGEPATPKVTVTNTGKSRVATQDVTLTLGPRGLSWLGWQEVYIVRGGKTEKNRCRLSETDARQAFCKGVKLYLDPGQSINVHTEVATSPDLEPCEMPRVHFQVGSAGADANFVMTNPDGTPAECRH
ncbi:hypothetical protein AB0J57_21040 [Streptomyces sp. NPDC049837]|uniref:hypothetical protein n=1 Tax=Streptomyces sp. NPDC049837 TaxID=3155277 RepID=UPI003429A0FD